MPSKYSPIPIKKPGTTSSVAIQTTVSPAPPPDLARRLLLADSQDHKEWVEEDQCSKMNLHRRRCSVNSSGEWEVVSVDLSVRGIPGRIARFHHADNSQETLPSIVRVSSSISAVVRGFEYINLVETDPGDDLLVPLVLKKLRLPAMLSPLFFRYS
jgi:hypothetical protein